jgi:hypothetical protein
MQRGYLTFGKSGVQQHPPGRRGIEFVDRGSGLGENVRAVFGPDACR